MPANLHATRPTPPVSPGDTDSWWAALQVHSPVTAHDLARRLGEPPESVAAWLRAMANRDRAFTIPPAEGETERRWVWCADTLPGDDAFALFDGLDDA